MSTTTDRLYALWQGATPSNIAASIDEAQRLLAMDGDPEPEAFRYMEGLLRVAEAAGHEIEIEGEEEG